MSRTASRYFIGVDAGGTNTRALLATESGEIVGQGYALGANALSSGTHVTSVIADAIAAALDDSDPTLVAGGVVALAGPASSRDDLGAEIRDNWTGLGLPQSPRLVPDVVAAFAAGTTSFDGVVLVAGTGSIAAAIACGKLVRRCGGHGWLVGDEGSAVWLGIEGIRAALMALDGRGQHTVLTETIPAALGVDQTASGSIRGEIVTATYSRPPARLGRLAPLVVDACSSGDQVANQIVESAARLLTATAVAAAGSDEPPRVVVLAGALLTKAAPISDHVRSALAQKWPTATLTGAASGEAGAVALAIREHTRTPITAAALARLRGV